MKKNRLKIIILSLLVILIFIGLIYISLNNSKQKKESGNLIDNNLQQDNQNIDPNINYEVRTEQNPDDRTKADIHLINPQTLQNFFYITLSNIDQRSNNAEYHNGNLYVVQGTTGRYVLQPDGTYKTPDSWKDELWKYDQQKNGTRIFSAKTGKGLGFMVSKDEKFIAVLNTNGELIFIKNDGTILKDFGSISTGEAALDLIEWAGSDFWAIDIDNTATAKDIFKIDVTSFEITKFDVSDSQVPAFSDYFALNPTKEIISFDNYPRSDGGGVGDEELLQKYASQKEIHLMLYNLKTKTEQQIAKSIGKAFGPKWLDENTLEYNNPNGPGRIIR